MKLPRNFICAGAAYSTPEKCVPAPFFRKSFELTDSARAELVICGLGFYELTVNGIRTDDRCLAPYVSNPDHLIYYDSYDLTPFLRVGENVLGICLGNGFQNNPGGLPWRFEQARWRSAPCVALRLKITYPDGGVEIIESDESFKTHPSPIVADDRLIGETYDARREIPGWDLPGFDDSAWAFAQIAPQPRGEEALSDIAPIRPIREIRPVSVKACGDGYLYDFGETASGVCRVEVSGAPGQQIEMIYGEILRDGKLDNTDVNYGLTFGESRRMHSDVFICSGRTQEKWTPRFVYHGFRYVLVKGITPEQAVPGLLTFVVLYSDLKERASFACSDEMANWLYRISLNSLHSNFHHYPTDCPQREKNGWTGDASITADVATMLLDTDKNYRQWMANIRKAQSDRGSIPGIVPTQHEWGYGWWHGPGPCWDSVLTNIPYALYRDRHDTAVLRENAHAVWRYLDHLSEALELTGDGIIRYGLGDWCHVGRAPEKAKCPQGFADTVYAMDMCRKAALFFDVLNKPMHRDFAQSLFDRIRANARERLIDLNTMSALGDCQSSQAMAIDFGLFEPAEKPAAFRRLMELIHEQDDHMDVGMFGAKSLFNVLTDFGQAELAYRMILRPDFPSYGYLYERGATSLPENLHLREGDSLNHQMWSDVARWLIRTLPGIRYNPRVGSRPFGIAGERISDVTGAPVKPCVHGAEADICPNFIESVTWAEGSYDAPEGEIRVRWERQDGEIRLNVAVPEILTGCIRLPKGWMFADTLNPVRSLEAGSYRIVRM